MILSAKCVTKDCERQDEVIAAGKLFLEKAGGPNGPFTCIKCKKPMQTVEEIREDIKGTAFLKSHTRKVSARTNGKPVGRKKKSGHVIKVSTPAFGARPKQTTKKTGQRKKVSGKRI
jgi:hypothetical protein